MSESVSVAKMRRRRAVLARRMARQGQLMRGTISMRLTRCGRKGCKCKRGQPHGPYLYVSVFHEGKPRSVYVPQHLTKEVRQWLENAKALEEDLAELTWLNARLLRCESKSGR